jgi:hypothetical protein
VAEWLCEQLSRNIPTVVGIDHAFSFPLDYFDKHRLPFDWPMFLDHFQRHCPTDGRNTYVDFVRDGEIGSWNDVAGDPSWFRTTENWTATAKSVFRFDVNGSVAKSTYSGLPWLRHLRRQRGERVHFWPFDGWKPSGKRSVVAEVYPSLWTRRFPREERGPDQQAAYATAAWLRRADVSGDLPRFFEPILDTPERKAANIEGWILGVV